MCRNNLANILLNASDVLIADLKAGTARSFDVDDELAGVGAGEIGGSDERKNSNQDYSNAAENQSHGSPRARQGASHPNLVTLQEPVEKLVKSANEAIE